MEENFFDPCYLVTYKLKQSLVLWFLIHVVEKGGSEHAQRNKLATKCFLLCLDLDEHGRIPYPKRLVSILPGHLHSSSYLFFLILLFLKLKFTLIIQKIFNKHKKTNQLEEKTNKTNIAIRPWTK